VEHARARPFVALGVLDDGDTPIGALVARTTDFDVNTPPRRVPASGVR
jgi:hypothetical protein